MTFSFDASLLVAISVATGIGLILGSLIGYLIGRSRRIETTKGAADWQLALTPITVSLDALAGQVARQEREASVSQTALRSELMTSLGQHALNMQRSTDEVRREAAGLTSVLSRVGARGRWGEMQLRRLVEASGMVDRVDFQNQSSTEGEAGTRRPDMIIRLAGGRSIVVDAKVPMDSFLQAETAPDATSVATFMRAHTADLFRHIDGLNGKDYRRQVPNNVEFLVMFLPAESLLEAGLRVRPDLLDYAFARNIVPATPTTLFALLRTVSLTWRQEKLSENAEEIAVLGRELYSRLGVLAQHFAGVGSSLDKAVGHYNKAIASLEARVLVTARALQEHGAADRPLSEPSPLSELTRPLAAREFIEDPLTTNHRAS